MDLEANKTMMPDCLFNHRSHTAGVTPGIDESKSVETVRPAPHNARDFPICGRIIGVKRSEKDGSIDPGAGRTP